MPMSHHSMVRMAKEKQLDYHQEAALQRRIREHATHKLWRYQLAEALINLASKLSPSHRKRLQQPLAFSDPMTFSDTVTNETLKLDKQLC